MHVVRPVHENLPDVRLGLTAATASLREPLEPPDGAALEVLDHEGPEELDQILRKITEDDAAQRHSGRQIDNAHIHTIRNLATTGLDEAVDRLTEAHSRNPSGKRGERPT
jgi:hypothetical protein